MSSKKQALVSVIVLNWNKPYDTVNCIHSIQRQTYKNIETIIIDNGSVDNSIEILEKQKNISLIKNPTNRGFTGGHIDGLKHANGDLILVLNNDAVMEPNYVSDAVKVLHRDKKIAVVGGRSYHWNGVEHNSSNNREFYAFQKINRVSGEGIFLRSDNGYDHEVSWVSGSSMLIRRSALDRVGYFYNPMFAYYEESDLFARLLIAGYKIVYSPSLKIYHKDGESSSSYFQYKQLFKNRFIFAVRNFDIKSLSMFLMSYSKTCLKGLYHYVTKNSDNTTLNKALVYAYIKSLLTWPRWLYSRVNLKRRDKNGFSFNDLLKIEQVGLSFIYDATKNINDITKITEFIKELSYRHYNSETIVVINKSQKDQAKNLIDKIGLNNTNLRFVYSNKHNCSANPLNFGWISAIKDYIYFLDETSIPSFQSINEACLLVKNDKSIYVETVENSVGEPMPTSTMFVARSILASHGGLPYKETKKSLYSLYKFSEKYKKISLIKKSSNYSSKKSIKTSLSSEEISNIDKTIIDNTICAKSNTIYHKLLERYYRLYQLNNLFVWLFIRDVSIKHKLARIKNLLKFSLTMQRRKLATEIKHISNEAVRSIYKGLCFETIKNEDIKKAEIAQKNNLWQKTPVFIICRDRLSSMLNLIKWLEKARLTNIIIIDNDSLYPPLVDFLETTKYQVVKTGKNIGHDVLWKEGIIKTLCPHDFYIVSDPDVIPEESCPIDAVKYFYSLHAKYFDYKKVGFGLKINDLPDCYSQKYYVMEWESQFWKNEVEPSVFEAGIDTTFALYKPHTFNYIIHPSLRTGLPYLARHTPWYVNSKIINEEEAFYRLRANKNITSWNTDEILDRYKREMNKKK